jgi:hypothetical protein
MAKYEYEDGERRTHKRIDITFDLKGWHDQVFNRTCHWFVDKYVSETIGHHPPGKSKGRWVRVYFSTISEAKRYIDDF